MEPLEASVAQRLRLEQPAKGSSVTPSCLSPPNPSRTLAQQLDSHPQPRDHPPLLSGRPQPCSIRRGSPLSVCSPAGLLPPLPAFSSPTFSPGTVFPTSSCCHSESGDGGFWVRRTLCFLTGVTSLHASDVTVDSLKATLQSTPEGTKQNKQRSKAFVMCLRTLSCEALCAQVSMASPLLLPPSTLPCLLSAFFLLPSPPVKSLGEEHGALLGLPLLEDGSPRPARWPIARDDRIDQNAHPKQPPPGSLATFP